MNEICRGVFNRNSTKKSVKISGILSVVEIEYEVRKLIVAQLLKKFGIYYEAEGVHRIATVDSKLGYMNAVRNPFLQDPL
jgi:hypothetical protein